MSQLRIPVTLLLLCFLFSCGDSSSENSATAEGANNSDSLRISQEPALPPLTEGDTVMAWVDGLYVRARPEKNAQIIAQVSQGTPLAFSGETSDGIETIVLRGIAFSEPWLRVSTAEGQTGWVFGGAVERRGMEKGIGQRDPEHLSFPKFGDFDLTEWEKTSDRQTSGGDATSTIRVYNKDGRRLTIRRTDTGDYGYEHEYTLKNEADELLKSRTLRFQTEPEHVLVEIVTDFTSTPPVQYRRSQPMQRHFAQLNARPEMASGPWEIRKPRN
ncbi:hypothetical protein GGR28_000207 [Lewinella aquimaris]|uniref:SH3b domain-containing protein n=1 Tax=Neolewinella aquimaris TaxID=1835722 RepID=A0A840E983_9BACT|nr:SH3 domain-containing protein [Neolewinella aquimaris]MBB4077606.1 hypothetical protein [Neolewinella aquimaris]